MYVLAGCAEQALPLAPAATELSGGGGGGGSRGGRDHRDGRGHDRDDHDRDDHNCDDHDRDNDDMDDADDHANHAGNAAITASAAYAGTGTVLTVTSFHRDDVSFLTPTGNIVKVQVKAYNTAGRLLWTRNFKRLTPESPTRQFTFTNVVPGTVFRIQAKVRGIDPRRADIVRTTATVVARPANLAVGAVQVVDRWPLNQALAIAALISETGGDLAVTATCALYVDGVRTSQVTGFTVSAGSSRTCNFSTSLTTVGSHEIRVAVEGMTPGDNNASDNYSLARVDTETPGGGGVLLPVFNFEADVNDATVDELDSTWTRITDLPGGSLASENSLVTARVGRDQVSRFVGTMYSRVTFPIARIVLIQRTGATVLHADTLTNLPMNGTGTESCTRGTLSGGVDYSLCTYTSPTNYAVLTYTRQAGSVITRSQAYDHVLLGTGDCTPDECWATMDTTNTGAIVPWSGALQFDVSVTAGDTLFAAAPSIPLATVNQNTVDPTTCTTGSQQVTTPGPSGITITVNQAVQTCTGGRTIRTGVGGAGSGVGATELKPVR